MKCDDCGELVEPYMKVTGTGGDGKHLSKGNTYVCCEDCFDEYWCCEDGLKDFFNTGESHPNRSCFG